MSVTPELRRQRQEGHQKFKINLGYTASSRLVIVTQQNPPGPLFSLSISHLIIKPSWLLHHPMTTTGMYACRLLIQLTLHVGRWDASCLKPLTWLFFPPEKQLKRTRPPRRHSVDKEGTSQSSSCPALLLPPPSFDVHSHGHSGAHGPDFNSRLDNQRSGEYHVYCSLDGPKRCVDLGLCSNPESQLPS